MAKAIVRINPKNGARKRYKSASAAAKALGFDRDTIRNAIYGTQHLTTYRGFRWEWANPRIPLRAGGFSGHTHSTKTKAQMSAAKSAKKCGVAQVTAAGVLVRTFESMTEASRCGFNRSGICDVIHGRRLRHGGYIWVASEKAD